MTFNEGMQIDTSTTSSSGGPGRIMAIGGGLGGLVIAVVALLLGVDPGTVLPAPQPGGAQQAQGFDVSQCKTGEDANRILGCRIIATGNSVDAVWSQLLNGYTRPYVRLFHGEVQTGCGGATTEVGPFYCPADKTAYFDTDFFQVLVDQFGSSGGPFAQEYVVAHEFGHHVQDLLGDIGRAQQGAQGALGDGGAHRTAGRLLRRCVGAVRVRRRQARKSGVASCRSSSRRSRSKTHCRRRHRWVTTGSRSSPLGESTRNRGHTDRRNSGSTGSRSATRPVTRSGATPMTPPTSATADRYRAREDATKQAR